MSLTPLGIPCLYENTYTDKVEDCLLVYNPISEKGLAVLNREAAYLFSLIDNKKNLGEILELAKKVDPRVKLENIIRIYNQFLSSEIIHFGKPKSKKEIFSKKPKKLGVWLHITNQCNLRCTYCYVYKTPDKMTDQVANKALLKIFSSAKKHGFEKITFKFSGGEALLELPKVIDLVKKAKTLAKKHKINVDFVIMTNGTLITEEVASTFKENDIRAAVSLDGLGRYNDKTRIFPSGKGSFIFVEQGIKNLLKTQVPFNVSVTITGKNIENIPDLTNYFLMMNIPFTFNFYRENPFVREKLEGDDKKLVRYLKKAYKQFFDHPPRYSMIKSLLDRTTNINPHIDSCGMGHNYLVVRHDGKITSCQMTLEKPIGSIEDEDVIETMIKGNFIRPKGLTVEGKTPCRTCQWKYVCCGGCPLLSFVQKGSYETSSPYCAVYKALIPEVLRIEAKRLIKYGVNQ